MTISPLVDMTVESISPLDEEAMAAARARQDTLTKPPGSLGRLEDLSIMLAGMFGDPIPRINRKSVILAAGDHGVVAEGVSAYPQEVTPQMVFNFLRGGAGINVLARQAGAEIVILDAGVAADLEPHPLLRSVKVAYGTANMAVGPAMTREQAIRCLEIGIEAAREQIGEGADLIACGDMGIGNTTASSAITSVATGADPSITTGRGTGLDDPGLAHKVEVIRRAIEVNKPDPRDGLDVLTKVGGLEIGVLAGAMLGTAASHRPVVVDGFISGAAALIAWLISPTARDYFIAAHQSVEPGHRVGLDAMGLTPLLDMGMRLGEGTGAALAMHLIEAAALCLAEMATFAEAGVSERSEDEE
ncbi:Nicotinate-nucleotide--dimethylbenzimidazole phosphoribosyltransferase [Geodia barretti]|uniref:Nicotinate-nucleotide--dimethylbenzimidazole phosphoribosyltransferase n=1 Tax=Geodia barretti TaxID=519541 RepID=A0AA35R8W6_GEOBA|nr:Nicotinate-nucleotide--dimethylbenzimidazole phosphoribosyltransferase [Geodia barretti]